MALGDNQLENQGEFGLNARICLPPATPFPNIDRKAHTTGLFTFLDYGQTEHGGLTASLSRLTIYPRGIGGASRGMPSHEGVANLIKAI